MQINITGHHVAITQALRNYVESKCERLARHFDQLSHIHVVLSVEKMRQKAEATLHFSGANVFASAEEEEKTCMPPLMILWTNWTGRSKSIGKN
jgi:putative sigma-54 modulation protein